MIQGYPAVMEIPVQWGDQDLFAHVNNTVYFRWFESSRVAYWTDSGLHEKMHPRGLGPILASVKCDYKKQIRYPDTIWVGAKVHKLGVSSVTLDHVVFSKDNDAVSAIGQSVIVLFNYEAQHPIPIEGDIREAFERFEATA